MCAESGGRDGVSIIRHKRKRRKSLSSSYSLGEHSTNDRTGSGSCTGHSENAVPDPSVYCFNDDETTSGGLGQSNNDVSPLRAEDIVLCSTPSPPLPPLSSHPPSPPSSIPQFSDVLFPSSLSNSESPTSPASFIGNDKGEEEEVELCQLMDKEEEEEKEEAEICYLMEDVNESDFNFTFNSSSHHINTMMTVMAASNEQTLNDGAESHLVYPSGTFYGLPETVRHCLKKNRGIEKLYDWQKECLSLQSVISGNNLIYSLPTSGGKTLVAEILILQQIILKKKDVIFILPYVSIVQEKVRELMPFSDELHFCVDEYASSKGRLPPVKKRKKQTVFIATIEKANALVNSLIELKRLPSIGLVVIDELHMLGAGQRGAVLESCITKLLFASNSTQLVGMSATLSNLNDLAHFMKAELFTGDFRPVELSEYVKLGQSLYSIGGGGRDVELVFSRGIQGLVHKADPDQLVSLVLEVIPSSCLIFCSTKKNCENVAIMLARGLPKSAKSIKEKERKMLIQQLRIEAAGLCPVLSQTVPYGVAYHHSGLTGDERKLIEEGYSTETLSIITCTSTLAAGVNLPAKRVIIRQPYIGRDFISLSSYKQMVGRAGRSGLCDRGESIVILQPQDKAKLLSVLSRPCDKCCSCLLSDNQQPLTSLLLSLIALKIFNSSKDIIQFLQCTLLYYQYDHQLLEQYCTDILTTLISLKHITVREEEGVEGSTYTVTNMGRAIHKGCLSVSDAISVYNTLHTAQTNLILTNDLHLLIIVVPKTLIDSVRPDWKAYFEKVSRLSPDEERVAQLYNINIGLLAGKYTGRSTKMSERERSVYSRFYIGLMLYSLLNTSSTGSDGVWVVADRFGCTRGFLQSIVQQTCSYSSCLVHFTEELPELWPFKLLLPPIVQKLSYSVSYDLLSLMEIQGMKQGRARQLVQAGIRSPVELVQYTASDLSQKIEHLYTGQAGKLIKAAKTLLTEKAELLEDEAHELLQQLISHTTL